MYPIPANATRIRYLESTGTQYVDTGVLVDPTVHSFLLDCSFEGAFQNTNSLVFIDARDTNANNPIKAVTLNFGGKSIQNKTVLGWFENQGGQRNSFAQNFALERGILSYSNGVVTRNGISISVPTSSGLRERTLLLCARRDSDNSTITAFGAYHVRVYGFTISSGSTIVRSFVPVRVGSTGYLFDRVSGELFGNAGTGAFVLGPDTFSQGVIPTRMMAMGVRKKLPTSLDYVQDGLVAMWDGIENVGRGVHDSSVTSWADLSGNGQTMSLHNASSFFDTSALVLPQNGTVYGLAQASSALSAVDVSSMTAECCVEISALVFGDSGAGLYWGQPCSTSGGITWGSLVPIGARFAASDIVFATPNKQYRQVGLVLTQTNVSHSVTTFYSTANSRIELTVHPRGAAAGTNPAQVGGAAASGQTNFTSFGVGYMAGEMVATEFKKMTPFTARIHSIRLYSRVLSDVEISANYAIDKVRFNLP